MPTKQAPLAQLRNLGNTSERTHDWASFVRAAWGSEFNAPDHGIYEFSNGRRFDSTDKQLSGIYNRDNDMGIMIDDARYPDMPSYLLVDTTDAQLDQN